MQRLISGIKQNGKSSWEMTEEERQKYPGDTESQRSQGPITLHSEETLVSSDRGVVMVRRLLRTMIDDVEAGRDPLGVSRFDGPPRRVEAGVFRLSADSGVRPELLSTAPANAIDVG